MKLSILASTLVLSLCNIALAADDETYAVAVSRVQLELNCQISPAQGGSTDCSILFSSRGKLAVTLTASKDGQGYAGYDVTKTSDSTFSILSLNADATKNLKSITMMKMNLGKEGLRGGIAINETNSLSAVYIAPMNIVTDANQVTTIKMVVLAYAPSAAANMVTSLDHKDLISYVLDKVQPAVVLSQQNPKLN